MLIVGWILFSIIPAVIASNKGRSAAGWFFLSLFISPLFAGILVACLSPLRREAEQRVIAREEMRKCPHCAELVKREAKICRYCQRELPEEAPAPEVELGPAGIMVPRIPTSCPRCSSDKMIAVSVGHAYHYDRCNSDFRVIAGEA